tara:strand:- start:13 stop:396 length:384 start_codon:yes stop_codon:yes gene_type:complete
LKKWEKPEIIHNVMTKYNYLVQYPENLELGENFDIGEFSYINANYNVNIEDFVQVGSHCSIYSNSTIDNKSGPVVLKKKCKIGTHSTVMPNVTVGENSIVSAYSFVTSNIPDNELWGGVPAVKIKNL